MKDGRSITANILSSDSRVGRAKKLEDASLPLVADLYRAHLEACATQRNDEPEHDGRKKSQRPKRHS